MANTWGMGVLHHKLSIFVHLSLPMCFFFACGKQFHQCSYAVSLVACAAMSISNQRLLDDASLGE